MINRELTKRERDMLEMIRPTTFQDVVDVIRRDIGKSKYDAKRELRNLHNGATNGVVETNGVVGTNGKNRIDNISGEICEE